MGATLFRFESCRAHHPKNQTVPKLKGRGTFCWVIEIQRLLSPVKVSLIIPAFNEERLLATSLAAITRAATSFSRRGWEWELIVCDNNSTDRTAEIAKLSGATVVFEPINQIARARNTGASIASGDWLIFIDADSEPSPELFTETADQIESGKILAGGAILGIDETTLFARFVAASWNRISRWGRWLAGSYIFVDAQAFRGLDGFSHDWFAAEEIELCHRLKRLARKQRRKIIILHRYPLKTSTRKATLYSPWEMARFILRTVFTGGRSLRNRDAAHLWYDGRR